MEPLIEEGGKIVDYHGEVIHIYSSQRAEDTAFWESMGLKSNCSDNGWLLSTKDMYKGELFCLQTRISILFTIAGPTDLIKGIKFIC